MYRRMGQGGKQRKLAHGNIFSQKCFASLRKSATFALANAEIAQLVEHNLAKVGVASSSLVFRSL